MTNEIIPYLEMCAREGASLQRGMNYRLNPDHSVILMSVRSNAPYADRLEDGGATLIYEGHDVPRTADSPDPKRIDQPSTSAAGSPTENGKFKKAAEDYRAGLRPPERVRVYEKLKSGIWSYNGPFALVDAWTASDGVREVFKFKLLAIEEDEPADGAAHPVPSPRRRMIPTAVKVEVWKRDHGACVVCGATDDLHFDHIVPFSKGGSSSTAANVQLLCARHNLEKRDKII